MGVFSASFFRLENKKIDRATLRQKKFHIIYSVILEILKVTKTFFFNFYNNFWTRGLILPAQYQDINALY